MTDASPVSLAVAPALGRARNTLALAVVGSAFVHAAFLAVPFTPGVHATQDASTFPVLEARLAPAEPAVTLQPVAQMTLPTLPEAAFVPMPSPRVEPTPARPPEPAPTALRSGELLVGAVPLESRARLGEALLARSLTEFPVELQFAPRVHEALKARYPEAALAQGIQGDVVVWIVVAPDGNVDEIEFAEGDPVFRDAVVEAIRAGRFQPGADHGAGVRAYLTLAFHFELPGGAPPGSADPGVR